MVRNLRLSPPETLNGATQLPVLSAMLQRKCNPPSLRPAIIAIIVLDRWSARRFAPQIANRRQNDGLGSAPS